MKVAQSLFFGFLLALFFAQGEIILRPLLGLFFLLVFHQKWFRWKFRIWLPYLLWLPFGFEFLLIRDPSWMVQWKGLELHAGHFFFWLGIYFYSSPNPRSLATHFCWTAASLLLLDQFPLGFALPLSILPLLYFLLSSNQTLLGKLPKKRALTSSLFSAAIVILLLTTQYSRIQSYMFSKFYGNHSQLGFDDNTNLNGFYSIFKSLNDRKKALYVDSPSPLLYLGGTASDYYVNGHWIPPKKTRKLDPQGGITNHLIFSPKTHHSKEITATIYPLEGLKSKHLFTQFSDQSIGIPEDQLLYSGGYYQRLQSKTNQVYYLLKNQWQDSSQTLPPAARIDSTLSSQLSTWLRDQQIVGRKPAPLVHQIDSIFNSAFTYSLTLNKPNSKEEPILYFLNTSRQGYCEWFASAGVLLLKSQAIPARFVKGFAFPEKVGNTSYLFRLKNAHAWVEYWNGADWVLWDPTPTGFLPPLSPLSETEKFFSRVELYFKNLWFTLNEGTWIENLNDFTENFSFKNITFSWYWSYSLLPLLLLYFFRSKQNQWKKRLKKCRKIFSKHHIPWEENLPLIQILSQPLKTLNPQEKAFIETIKKHYLADRFKN